jgi:broad specificity phosphatase PhoE
MTPPADQPPWTGPRLLLLRHGHIASHRGDVPLTERGHWQARLAGQRLGESGGEVMAVLHSPTVRTRETAAEFYRSLCVANPALRIPEPRASFALRNPDLYLAGHHVNMVSTVAAFCEQAPALTEEQCLRVPFFAGFLSAPDRIGYWVGHSQPPGDDAAAVAGRVTAFARSLGDVPGRTGQVVVGMTHSPLLRAIAGRTLGADPGEPEHLHGYSVRVDRRGALHVDAYRPFDEVEGSSA